jgi:hypothetical protein
MAETDLSAEAIAKLSRGELIKLVQSLDPADPAIKAMDIDAVGSLIDPTQYSEREFLALFRAIEKLAKAGAYLDLTRMDPQNFARLITSASREQLYALLEGEQMRRQILDEVFRRLESHFRPDKAGITQAVVRWRLAGGSGPGGYDRYEVSIKDGVCKVGPPVDPQPRVTVTVNPVEFLRIASGNASAPVLFLTGKLKLRGDLGFAMGMQNLFDIPKTPAQ